MFLKNKLKNRKTLTKRKLSRNFKSENSSNLQNRSQRHSFIRKRAAHGIREKIKTMALDTQANLAESGGRENGGNSIMVNLLLKVTSL